MLAFDLSGWATLAAASVALVVATGPLVWRRIRHPTLDLTAEQDIPWVRRPYYDDNEPSSVWFRAKVENVGHAEARNVRAVVTGWSELTDASKGWTQIDLDPSALHWVSLPWGWRQHEGRELPEVRGSAPVVNVPPRSSELVDLISYNWENGEHDLVLDYDRPRGYRLRRETPEGEFVLTVLIAADNVKSITKHVHYRTSGDGKQHLTDVGVLDEPPVVQANKSGHSSQGIGEPDSSRT